MGFVEKEGDFGLGRSCGGGVPVVFSLGWEYFGVWRFEWGDLVLGFEIWEIFDVVCSA